MYFTISILVNNVNLLSYDKHVIESVSAPWLCRGGSTERCHRPLAVPSDLVSRHSAAQAVLICLLHLIWLKRLMKRLKVA